MAIINPDKCGCCGEIWNRTNLKTINMGKNKLLFCPDCFKEYETIIYNAFKDGYNANHENDDVQKAFQNWNKGLTNVHSNI